MSILSEFETVVRERVTFINEKGTEEDLINAITSSMKENIELKGVRGNSRDSIYVYSFESVTELELIPFKTIEQAVRYAVNKFNAYIIHRGEIIKYDVLDDFTAYYHGKHGKINLIKLC